MWEGRQVYPLGECREPLVSELLIGTGATPCGLGGLKAMFGVKMDGGRSSQVLQFVVGYGKIPVPSAIACTWAVSAGGQ